MEGPASATQKWHGRWSGGRYRDVGEVRHFFIEKMVGGVRYAVKLDVHSEVDALAELALFMRDPVSYRTRSQQAEDEGASVVRITQQEITRFMAYLEKKQCSYDYRAGCRTYLVQWANALKAQDLRSLRVREVHELLSAWEAGHRYRLEALKSFLSFLAREEVLPKENVGSHLRIERPPPAKVKTGRRGYEISAVEELYSNTVAQSIRDVLLLRAKFGLHHTEIERIAEGGGEVIEVGSKSGIAAVIRYVHKSRREHRQSIDAQGVAALRRLMAKKKAPKKESVWMSFKRTALRIKQPEIAPNQLRHSFVTWAKDKGRVVRIENAGVSLDLIAMVVGHGMNVTTTKAHYDNSLVPPMIAIPINLAHKDDPPLKRDIADVDRLKVAR
jgi:hypothetical protein